MGIKAFDILAYDLEVTPFLGKLLDGKYCTFGLSVMDGIATWFVDANLHLWLDKISVQILGMLVDYKAPAFIPLEKMVKEQFHILGGLN